MGRGYWYEAERLFWRVAKIASFIFLDLFKDEGYRMSPKFHLFVSDVNQEKKEAG